MKVALTKECLLRGETLPGAIYEVRARLKPPASFDVEAVERRVYEELPRRARVRVLYVELSPSGEELVVQLEGSPIPWSLILANLDLILAALGFIVLAIVALLIWFSLPEWARGALAVAAGASFAALVAMYAYKEVKGGGGWTAPR